MAFESDLILCKLAIDQKFITEREFYECLKEYQTQKQQKALLDILLEKEILFRTQATSLLQNKEEQNYQSLVAGYQILSLLGLGGMGCVYRAIQTSMEREVALKILPVALAKDQEFISRFRTEAKLTGRFNHVNLITGYDVGEYRGVYFFAMELVNGTSLDQYLKQNKKALSEDKAVDFVLQVARALECAYEYHIVHRDIKPENILITAKGVAKLADLGLAKVALTKQTKTERGLIVGTPWYLSPEQATGEEELDCRADIYSLGITLYQLLTNEIPFDGDSAAVVMTKHIIEPLPSIRAKNPKVPEALCEIVKKMTAKDKKNRYQTPMELIRALEEYRRPPPSASASVTSILNLEALEPPKPTLSPRSSQIEKDRFHFCYVPSEEDVWFAKIALKNKVLTPLQIKKALDYQERQCELGLKDTLAFFLMDEEMITLKQKKIMMEVLEKILWKEKQGGLERIVLKNKWVPEETMKKIMAHLEQTPGSSLLDFLIKKSLLNSAQKQQLLLEEQKNNGAKIDGFLAQALVDCKFCKYDQIQEALETQKLFFQNMQQVKPLGTLLIEKGHLYEDQLQSLLRAYNRKEITQQPVKEILDEKRKLLSSDTTGGSKSNTKMTQSSTKAFEGGGIFDNIRFAKSSNDFCPYCDAELVFGATSCRSCGKSVK